MLASKRGTTRQTENTERNKELVLIIVELYVLFDFANLNVYYAN